MADYTAAPTNKKLVFRGKPSTAPGKAAEMAALAPAFPKKRMPKKVRKATKTMRARGMISERAMKKHFGE